MGRIHEGGALHHYTLLGELRLNVCSQLELFGRSLAEGLRDPFVDPGCCSRAEISQRIGDPVDYDAEYTESLTSK
jgi:hypothetical protein